MRPFPTPASSVPTSISMVASIVFGLVFGLVLAIGAEAAPPAPGPRLGTNLAWLGPNTGEYPFVDLFPTSFGWVPAERWGCWNCSGPLDLDDDGWVRSLDPDVGDHGQAAYIHHFFDLVGRYPAGEYTVLYDGVGQIDYEGSAQLVSRDPNGGRDTIDVDPSHPEELIMVLVSTGSGSSYLRNIRLLPPGGACSGNPALYCDDDSTCSAASAGTCRLFAEHPDEHRFHPHFLANLEPFDVVRMMDWMRTVDSDVVDYDDDYTQMDDAHWQRAPAQVMAELANVLDVDLWVNVPHRANATFAADFAADLAATLEPGRQVFVEYSNEVWNPTFQQFWDVTADGCAAYAGILDCDDPIDELLARLRQNADRARAVWSDFETALGASRVVKVLAGQTGNTWMNGYLLDWNGTAAQADVVATAAYFGWTLGDDEAVAGWSDQRLMEELRDVEIPATLGWMRDDVQLLASDPAYAHLQQVFYEGGQHLQAFGDIENDPTKAALLAAMNARFDTANTSSDMALRYDELLDGWMVDGGGVLFLHYVNVHPQREWGRFGALEWQGQDPSTSPKYNTLRHYLP